MGLETKGPQGKMSKSNDENLDEKKFRKLLEKLLTMNKPKKEKVKAKNTDKNDEEISDPLELHS